MAPSPLQVAQYNDLKRILDRFKVSQLKEIIRIMRLSQYGRKAQLLEKINASLDQIHTSNSPAHFQYIRKKILEENYGFQRTEELMKNDGTFTLAQEYERLVNELNIRNTILNAQPPAPLFVPASQLQRPTIGANQSPRPQNHQQHFQQRLQQHLLQQQHDNRAGSHSPLPSGNSKILPKELYTNLIPMHSAFLPTPFYNIIEIATKPKTVPSFYTGEAKRCFEMPIHLKEKLEKTFPLVERFKNEEWSAPDFDIIAETDDDEHPELILKPKEAPVPAIYSLFLFCIPSGELHANTKNLRMTFPARFEVFINGKHHDQTPLPETNNQWLYPLDLTPYIMEKKDDKLTIPEKIHLHMRWSANYSKMNFLVYLVHRIMPQTLYSILLREESRLRPRSLIISEYLKRKDDDVLEMGDLTISLKCPLAYTPIRLPVRGSQCKHLQCFDLWNFLLINQDSYQFTCPICHKKIFEKTQYGNLSNPSYSMAINDGNQCYVFDGWDDIGRVSLFRDKKPPECEKPPPEPEPEPEPLHSDSGSESVVSRHHESPELCTPTKQILPALPPLPGQHVFGAPSFPMPNIVASTSNSDELPSLSDELLKTPPGIIKLQKQPLNDESPTPAFIQAIRGYGSLGTLLKSSEVEKQKVLSAEAKPFKPETQKSLNPKAKPFAPLTTGLQVCGFFTEIIYQIRKAGKNLEQFSSVVISENGDYTLIDEGPTPQNDLEDEDDLDDRKRHKTEHVEVSVEQSDSNRVVIDLTADDNHYPRSNIEPSNLIVINSSEPEEEYELEDSERSVNDDVWD